jgi:hypothetical protein
VERNRIKRNKLKKEGRVEESEKKRNNGQCKTAPKRSVERKESPYGWKRRIMWRSKGR